uniref:Ubiquitin-associated /TS-N domain-containing protein n=1 Tax=Solanum tuberosum TaxID=4113 RepID=M1CJX4_SOLTU
MDASDINRSLMYPFVVNLTLHFYDSKSLLFSGNSSLEAAVNWIVDHEDETYNDEMPMERIRAGKERLATKRMAEENERKRFEAQRKTEKEEERRARERIRQKLQQDMADRKARLGSSLNSGTSLKSIKTSEPETKNPLKVDSAMLSGNLITKKEVLMECLRSLRRQHKEEDMKVQRAFKTLLVYVRNIVSNPDDGKFRKIRLSNPAFQARVGLFKEGVQFLELCGFERAEKGDFLVLRSDKVDMALLRSAGMVLHTAITNPFFGLLSM